MLSADKVSEIFCIADDFCQEFDREIEKMSLPLDGKKHRRRKGQMSDSEIMTILICFHCKQSFTPQNDRIYWHYATLLKIKI